MAAPLDLYRARREELIALVLRQRERIADLEQRLAGQEAEVGAWPARRRRWAPCGQPSPS
jgi:hypothetical protein